MKILLVSATKFEVSYLLTKFKKISSKDGLFSYRFGKHSLDVLITGVGMMTTAFYLGKYLSKKYDLAINAGVAGSFKKSISLGTVVNVVSDYFADLGAEDGGKFITLKKMGFKLQVQGLNNKQQTTNFTRAIESLPKVNGITVNTVHGNVVSIKKVVFFFNPDVESMEGAAFFFACNQFKTPCIQIRAVSNYVERRNKKKWKMELAVKNLNLFLEPLIGGV